MLTQIHRPWSWLRRTRAFSESGILSEPASQIQISKSISRWSRGRSASELVTGAICDIGRYRRTAILYGRFFFARPVPECHPQFERYSCHIRTCQRTYFNRLLLVPKTLDGSVSNYFRALSATSLADIGVWPNNSIFASPDIINVTLQPNGVISAALTRGPSSYSYLSFAYILGNSFAQELRSS